MRGTIAGAALLLGYVSTTQTLAFALIKSNTVRGHTLAPDDGRIAGELAEQILTSGQPARRASADRLARAALVDEPLAVPALTARALAAQIAGDTA
ncbi:hypothetical protein, partial [Sphingomonas sp. 179-A 2A2 NHS]|uniref:hypothetical protein n=1 Tax=Sphingomonas sp. 179-A 2A2 NHS TaxID=3374290 RepID=UPI00387A58B6